MAEALPWEVVRSPEELFARGSLFVEVFGEHVAAGQDPTLINPMDHPLEFAEAVAALNPRHPQSVFRKPEATPHDYEDRYAIADNGLPAWAAPFEPVINDAAHDLGVRDKELGTTFQHDFTRGDYQRGLVLEGANKASLNRGMAMGEAIQNRVITVERVDVVGTDRVPGPREGHGDNVTGYDVAAKTALQLREAYPDIFCPGGVELGVLDIRTHRANAREVVAEAILRHGLGSVVMSGSNIYGTWMRTDMATVQHSLNGVEQIGFGAGPDDPKAPRTPLIWAAECSQVLVSAAHLRHAQKLKQR